MATTSTRNVSNLNYTQVEPLMTVQRLKDTYLFGVEAKNEHGDLLSDEAIQMFINVAVSTLEHDLDLAIMPRKIVEQKDYNTNDYYDWGYLQLNRYPVISIDRFRIIYLRDAPSGQPLIAGQMDDANNNFQDVMDIPPSWMRLDPDTGILRLIPNNRFPSRLQVDASGAFFPELFNRYSSVPNLWEITYTHGFKEGCIPALINAAIGLIASNYYLNIAGDLLIGAGIAATSISLDALSQSIQTTSSAENNGFSAKIKDNNRQLYGDKMLGTTGILEAIRRFYKGPSINII